MSDATDLPSLERRLAEASDYEMLKAIGHSPAKAAEILLDASRGDDFSVAWLRTVRRALSAQPTGAGE